MHCCRFYAYCMLLTLAAPLWADPPIPAAGSAQPVLDGLVGKHRVIGFTERGGKRFLGRVLSGDHGLYVVQTFHYVSAPATTTETTTQTGYVPSGRFGRLRPVSRRVKTQETTRKTIADAVAIRALVSGVAGPTFRPAEQSAGREMVASADVTYLQELLPPATTSPAPAAPPAPVSTAAASTPASVPSVTPAAAHSTDARWTLKTLWAAPK